MTKAQSWDEWLPQSEAYSESCQKSNSQNDFVNNAISWNDVIWGHCIIVGLIITTL